MIIVGWTFMHDDRKRKTIMDELYSQSETVERPEHRVLKSSIVGSVYYAAVQISKGGNVQQVYAAVALTKIVKDYYNFGYKDMSESCCPYYYNCPKTVFDLLTPTDNELAIQWRVHVKERMQLNKLNKLPEGSIIQFVSQYNLSSGTHKGDTVTLHKFKNGKRCIWTDGDYKWDKEYISADFEIVQEGVVHEKTLR